ncbi:MAG: hypothetical protein A3G24_18950 [Betaproteobacteria bacterium RIFCSPLOWO2_12_FULL_62_13]|nr:MAG: hypothetical protein A3G24_18950 [Betaproteobacteria bacterium RIFCSPLOWO2_12_FULL_62_13]
MKRSIVVWCALAFLTVGMAYAKLPPPTEEQKAKAAAAKAKAAKEAKKQAAALAKAQDRVVARYKQSRMPAAPARVRTVERLACLSGNEDRHARIGVELIDGKVNYFAYYSKWKPRTCSIEVKRGGAYGRWEDHGATSRVTLVDGKGVFLIDGKNGSYRFVFRGIDRGRYCGMDGKINGSLTVIRGKSDCIVEGVMDGHAG